MKSEAIINLYPTVKTVETDTDGNIKAYDNDGNEVSIDMSTVETKATELQTAKDNEQQAKETLKASAKAKLVAGTPLTEDEANILTGV